MKRFIPNGAGHVVHGIYVVPKEKYQISILDGLELKFRQVVIPIIYRCWTSFKGNERPDILQG